MPTAEYCSCLTQYFKLIERAASYIGISGSRRVIFGGILQVQDDIVLVGQLAARVEPITPAKLLKIKNGKITGIYLRSRIALVSGCATKLDAGIEMAL